VGRVNVRQASSVTVTRATSSALSADTVSRFKLPHLFLFPAPSRVTAARRADGAAPDHASPCDARRLEEDHSPNICRCDRLPLSCVAVAQAPARPEKRERGEGVVNQSNSSSAQ